MDLAPSSEQEAMVAATADWCRGHLPLDRARNRPADLWAELEAMGWTGLTAPDIGLDHATEALVFTELGRHLAPMGLLASAVAARWTPHPGKAALALFDNAAPGGMLRVFDPQDAQRALGLVGHLAATTLLPSDLCGRPSLDPSALMARLDPAPAFEAIGEPRTALHLQLLAASYAVGCADAAREMAAAYALVREQFERPIGSFQALKHICADMAVRSAVARSQLCYAACALDADDSEAAFHIASAKQLSDQAAMDNGRANIQVHGGIGMTDEASPHLFLKRAHLLSFIAPAQRDVILGEAA